MILIIEISNNGFPKIYGQDDMDNRKRKISTEFNVFQ